MTPEKLKDKNIRDAQELGHTILALRKTGFLLYSGCDRKRAEEYAEGRKDVEILEVPNGRP